MTEHTTFIYHLEKDTVIAILEQLAELPHKDVYDLIGDLLIEHKKALKRPYHPVVVKTTKAIEGPKE